MRVYGSLSIHPSEDTAKVYLFRILAFRTCFGPFEGTETDLVSLSSLSFRNSANKSGRKRLARK
jgi:hypothetical protein